MGDVSLSGAGCGVRAGTGVDFSVMADNHSPKLEAVLRRLAIKREDRDAWAILYDLMWSRVLAITFRALRGVPDRAEDAGQEVFIRLFRYCDFSKVQNPEDFLPYLHTI